MLRIFAGLIIALLATPAIAVDPITFFRGPSHGDGRLKVLFQPVTTISVDSRSVQRADGSLVMRQTIRDGVKPARIRYWRMRSSRTGGTVATLTDAAGPVQVVRFGDTIRIRYTQRDGLNIEQWLTPDGPRTLRNHMTIGRFGITVARLDEIIRKLD